MVNALKKEEPVQRHSANKYTSMSHFFGFHFMSHRKKINLFWSDIFHSLSFFYKCIDDRSHKLTVIGNTKKVNGHNLQCSAPFKT